MPLYLIMYFEMNSAFFFATALWKFILPQMEYENINILPCWRTRTCWMPNAFTIIHLFHYCCVCAVFLTLILNLFLSLYLSFFSSSSLLLNICMWCDGIRSAFACDKNCSRFLSSPASFLLLLHSICDAFYRFRGILFRWYCCFLRIARAQNQLRMHHSR